MMDVSSSTSALFFAAAVIPLLFMACLNVVFGIIALNMAKKRGLRTVPAFFAGLFGSFIALFFIAMFPVQS